MKGEKIMGLDATKISIDFRFHFLKTLEPYFNEIVMGRKTFEVRKADRDYRLGDYLELREYDLFLEIYTGETIIKRISYILDDPDYVKEGYVILGLGEPEDIFKGTLIGTRGSHDN